MMKIRISITLFLAILIISGCALDGSHEKEILHFRQKRINYLKSRLGYLNLVGLYWFNDGQYQLGSGPDNDMVLPDRFPNQFGTFSKSGDQLQFQFNAPVLLDSTNQVTDFSFSTSQLEHTFSWESFQWFVIKRGANYAIRLKDFENPNRNPSFEISYYPIDARWKIKGSFEAYPAGQNRTISNIFGHPIEQPTTGIISFDYEGNTYRLETHIEGEKVAVIFKDATTGNETYFGGRQLYVSETDENGTVILDFNKSFNFPCAYNDFTTCPVPPPINHLDLNITAGAKVFK
ncbi:MAG: DUF1684 domain-containing protein [Candidatus Marinimicrobia bacterium]|nr:DUF1684 domain-containing protein [Candidatus Neomarinimicrobiota bacterium]